MPLRAILQHDLRNLCESRIVRLWLAATALLTAAIVLTNWAETPSAPLVAMLLFPFLVFPWFLVVMLLGVNPTSGARAETLADGFLCRPVTRLECLLGTWVARLLAVGGVYLVVTAPAVAVVVLADRPPTDDGVTLYGIVAALGVVGLVLALQVSLGVLVGILLRRSLLAVAVLLLTWFPVNLVLHTFSLEQYSPITLSQRLPALLQQPWRAEPEADTATGEDMEALAQQAAQFLSVLSGAPPQPAKEPGFFDRAAIDDFSLRYVVLGYGIPTLLSIGLAAVCFHMRDF